MCSDKKYLDSGIEKELGKMTSNCEGSKNNPDAAIATLPQSDVEEQMRACESDVVANFDEVPAKKRRTRRRKNKRRHPYNYLNKRKTEKLVKPEAPHNSNQFLIEDQVNIKELDGIFNERLPARTRDSSFSLDDSEGEFYSSPDDEEAFLMKEFDDQYQTIHTERLNTMTNNELIQECIQLEKKVDYLTKRVKSKSSHDDCESIGDSREEMAKLALENEALRRENIDLRNRLNASHVSVSSPTASGSSDPCSSCSSSSDSEAENEEKAIVEDGKLGPNAIDYTQSNGHSPNNIQPV